jgi:hypothetical protein
MSYATTNLNTGANGLWWSELISLDEIIKKTRATWDLFGWEQIMVPVEWSTYRVRGSKYNDEKGVLIHLEEVSEPSVGKSHSNVFWVNWLGNLGWTYPHNGEKVGLWIPSSFFDYPSYQSKIIIPFATFLDVLGTAIIETKTQ